MKQPPVRLVALKRMTYNTRRLVAGDVFEASNKDARILVGVKRAEAAPPPSPPLPRPRPAPPPPPPPPEPDLDQLRATARSLGIVVDNRWGARTLQAEIAKHGTT